MQKKILDPTAWEHDAEERKESHDAAKKEKRKKRKEEKEEGRRKKAETHSAEPTGLDLAGHRDRRWRLAGAFL